MAKNVYIPILIYEDTGEEYLIFSETTDDYRWAKKRVIDYNKNPAQPNNITVKLAELNITRVHEV